VRYQNLIIEYRIVNKESKEYVTLNGRLKVSENAVTSPGNLPCNFLIHAVGPYYHTEAKNRSIV
jgi:O-acetyl-ADP-ribose deacetylase (regulator of RNase III)